MRLKELQKNCQFTIKESADRLGIPMSTYNGYLVGNREPDIETLIKLANYFRTSVDYLIGRDVEQVNLNAIKPVKKKLIQYIIQMNELQEIKAEAYLDGLFWN